MKGGKFGKVINEKTKQSKLITSKYDRMFKAIMCENKDILESVLSTVLDRPVKIISFLNPELNIKNLKERNKTLDLTIKLDDEFINCEVNTSHSLSTRVRNLNFFYSFVSQLVKRGNEYDTKTKYIQINLTYGLSDKHKIIEEYTFKSSDTVYYDNHKIIEVNMDKINELWYAKSELDISKYKYLMMLNIDTIESLQVLGKGDYIVEKYSKNLETLNEDRDFIWGLTWEEDKEKIHRSELTEAKEEGFKQGTKQKASEMANEMLKANIPIETIQEISKLSIKEIKALKNYKEN